MEGTKKTAVECTHTKLKPFSTKNQIQTTILQGISYKELKKWQKFLISEYLHVNGLSFLIKD